MLKIYLARHGQDQDNFNGILNGHRDNPLTALGEQQAQKLAEHIKNAGLKFDAVYSSPLQRAYKTAEAVTDELGMEKPVKQQDLIEQDMGDMTGKPIADIEKLCAPYIIKVNVPGVGETIWFYAAENMESYPESIERAKRALDFIKSKHPNGNVLLVAHGTIGKMLYAAYYNLDWQDVLKLFHFGNSELILLSEDSMPEDVHLFQTEQFNH